jgi:3-oxoacyl-[acyl-carrier-protein] synthase-1
VKRRVAVTGLGLVSCLGHEYAGVSERLQNGESGVVATPEWDVYGIKSLVAGMITGTDERRKELKIPKKLALGMSDSALYCAMAAKDAVAGSGLGQEELASPRTACIVGSGTGSVRSVEKASQLTHSGQIRRVDPFTVLRCMASSTSAGVANLLGIHGPSYSISSACATSTHNIGHACQLIQAGVIDKAVAGGGEDCNHLVTAAFQGLRIALSTRYNDTPTQASRPFDAGRDGFVISGGGGVLVLEDLEQAQRRGAPIRAEIVGYAANSDGYDMVLPEPDGVRAAQCMELALADAELDPEAVDYVNTHGTATTAGDVAELRALRRVFGDGLPAFSSTKSMTGHGIGAAGVLEIIFCIAMLEHGFLAPSINVDEPDPEVEGMPLVTETSDRAPTTVLSNNFGFGGTNASIVVRRADG